MAEIKVDISFNTIYSHRDLVQALSPIAYAQQGDTVNFTINLNTSGLLFSDYLLLLASTIINLKRSKVKVKGKFIHFDRSSTKMFYASRVNFFKLINFEFEESFNRRSSEGRFTEIKEFNEDNIQDIHKEVIKILLQYKDVNNSMLRILDYCLWEVLDNTLNHSDGSFIYGKGSGYVCSQYFPKKEEIRIMIADTGIGIHKSLTTHPNTKHSHLNEREAVEKSIERNITNSAGRGFGLWATAEMIRENKGKLIIHSGHHQLVCKNNKEIIKTAPWKGTYTYLKINTDIPIEYEKIFGENDSQKNSFEEFKENLTGISDDLW